MRIIYLLLALVLLIFGGAKLWEATRSPEEKIAGKLADAEEAFNDSRLRPCLDLFDRNFTESTKGYTYDDVKRALIGTFMREVHPTTKELLYRVAISEIEIEVFGEIATTAFFVELSKKKNEDWPVEWSFRFAGEMIESESDGWQFTKGTVETTEGARPR